MKFLALHGAIGNPANFAVQLHPLVEELKQDGCEFHFAQGGVEVKIHHDAFQDYYGPGPHYRFFDDAGVAEKAMLNRVRDFPERDTPEDTLRDLGKIDTDPEIINRVKRETLDRLYDILEADQEIQGIIGYSEGSVVAGTLLLDEQHRFETTGRPRQLKCFVSFAGWPPIDHAGNIVFCDETDTMIDMHSIHVVGANDPYLAGSMALYNDCNEDTAMLFDHGKGHTIPRDPQTLRELAKNIREMLTKAGLDYPSGNSSDVESSFGCPNDINSGSKGRES